MPIDVALARRALDPGVFELIVLPTEQCNFRCTYCYEDFAVGAMSAPTVNALKQLIGIRADGTCDLVLSWFGGEPLLAAETVLEVSQHAQQAFTSVGRRITGHITTNGYLLRPHLFSGLCSVGITNFQITLDGPAAVHDRRRVRRDGRGSFDTIWANLLAMRALAEEADFPPFEVVLRLHFDGASVELLGDLIEDVIKEFAAMPGRFRVNLHELERLGGPNDGQVVDLTEVHAQLTKEYAERLVQAGLSTMVAAEVQGYVCYASRANALVVRSDGRLNKCTVALTDERNDVGRLLPNGALSFDTERLLPWLRGVFSGDADELSCPKVGLPGAVGIPGDRVLLPLTPVAAGRN